MELRTRRGSLRGRRGPSGPKPVKEGDMVEVEVVEKSRRGLQKWRALSCLCPAPSLGRG
jgi:hypothetical protein